jgi:GrpB-like predicted nucleotidyltransferase (UPF0157 family)
MVDVAPYSCEWPHHFDLAADQLRRVFGPAVQVEHIGSTAVPGLVAKPIIDVLAGASSLDVYENAQVELESLGFVRVDKYDTRLPERRYFVRDAIAGLPRVNLHAVVMESRFWCEHLAFRDALRRDAALAARYARLKTDLAARYRFDRPAYTAAKQPFIEAVLRADRS